MDSKKVIFKIDNQDVTPTDDQGRPHGRWVIYFYESSNISYVDNFVHGVLQGVHLDYYRAGGEGYNPCKGFFISYYNDNINEGEELYIEQ